MDDKQPTTVADTLDAIFGPGTAEASFTPAELEIARQPQSYEPPPHCHHVKLKVTASGLASPQHPQAPLGMHNGGRTVMITNVPAGTPLAEVVRRYSASVDTGADVAYSFDTLGAGRILR